MEDEDLKVSFVRDVILLQFIGVNPVIVHGGGPQIDGMLDKIGKKSQFIEGMRVTDEETMEVVEMVLVGKITKRSSPGSTPTAGRPSAYRARRELDPGEEDVGPQEGERRAGEGTDRPGNGGGGGGDQP